MSEYLRLQSTAGRLIKQKGAEYRMRRFVPGTPDPVEGTVGTETEEFQNIQAVILPPKTDQKFTEMYKGDDGTLNLSNVMDILISPQDLTWPPHALEEVEYEGEWWTLGGMTMVKPDGKTSLLYKGFIRRT